MFSVLRGGLPRISRGSRRAVGEHAPGLDVRRERTDCCARWKVPPVAAAELTNDPIARRRELLIVLELCAARERGALERLASGVTLHSPDDR